MKSNAIFYFILVILMNYVLMSTDVDFKKNGKYPTESSNEYGWAIFDSSDFKKGDEIYFKVTADHFTNNLLYFYFYDEPADIIEHESNVANLKYVSYSKKENNKNNGETAYFTVKKNDENLGSLKGNYLLLQVEATGKITFENTAENQGKVKTIVIVVIVVVVVIALAIGIFCYCRRRKAMMNMQGNNYNDNVNVYNNNYNNNNYNNPGQNNYGPQQQYPNNQNYNMNNNIQNNAYSNNNNQNAGNYGYPNQQYNGVPQSSNRYP